ncbi:MAG: TetR/AcrR family transcriptional regulator [Janthinobacterium lividum]
MPRVSRQQTEQNRLAIEEASSRLFREQGLHGVSVAELMAAAGLTHGGFYGHFESKDALAALACTHAFEQSSQRWARHVARASTAASSAGSASSAEATDAQASRGAGQAAEKSALRAIVDSYLNHRSRDHAGSGCPAAGLVADVAREAPDKPVHAAYVDGVKSLVDTLASLRRDTVNGSVGAAGAALSARSAAPTEADYQHALVQMSTLVGALLIARATRSDPISDQVLGAARAALLGADG